MTIAVDLGRKATKTNKQTNKLILENIIPLFISFFSGYQRGSCGPQFLVTNYTFHGLAIKGDSMSPQIDYL